MPEVIFTGPAGRLEGRYHPAKQKNAPIAMVLHPHPQFHGTMNHQIIYQCYYAFAHRGFSVLRFNFRGVGRSQGSFDHGTGELSDAASALDWAQTINPEARACWVAGFSFGAWIGMQLLMRRPEVEGFISIAPPANLYDFSFLAPCPSSGLIVHGEKDAVVPPKDVNTLVEKLKTQKGIVIDQQVIPGANHFFDGKLQPLMETRDRLSRHAARQRSLGAETAMGSFVALLRAVNVGGTGKLPMSELKEICEKLGFESVSNLHRQRQCGLHQPQIRSRDQGGAGKAACRPMPASRSACSYAAPPRWRRYWRTIRFRRPRPTAPWRCFSIRRRRRTRWPAFAAARTNKSNWAAAKSISTTAKAWPNRSWSLPPPRPEPRAT